MSYTWNTSLSQACEEEFFSFLKWMIWPFVILDSVILQTFSNHVLLLKIICFFSIRGSWTYQMNMQINFHSKFKKEKVKKPHKSQKNPKRIRVTSLSDNSQTQLFQSQFQRRFQIRLLSTYYHRLNQLLPLIQMHVRLRSMTSGN